MTNASNHSNSCASPYLTVTQLTAGYPVRRGPGKKVCDKVSFSLPQGTLTGLLGSNGSGKTTLLKAICGLLPHTGNCTLDGQVLEQLNTKQRARLLSYIPQRSGIQLSLSVLEVVLMGFHAQLGLLEPPSKAQRALAQKALEQVGIPELCEQDYLTLSEGQKQLCILARTLVEDTRLLLLDEPDSALDYPNRHAMMTLLRQMVQTGRRSGLLSLHDPLLALEYCDQLLLLKEGKCLTTLHPRTDAPAQMEEALRHIYGEVHLVTCPDQDGLTHLILLPAKTSDKINGFNA